MIPKHASCTAGLWWIVLLAVFAPLISAADTTHFPSNEDLRHIGSLNDPRVSPDGKQVLVRMTESTADGGKSHLWVVDVDADTSRQLTYSPDADKSGENQGTWMPDGRSVLFVAHRTDHTQLFRLPMQGGEAKAYDLKVVPPADASKQPDALPPPSTKDKNETKSEPLPLDVKSFEIAPDGKTIAVLANDPKTPGEKKQSEAKADAVWVNHEIHGQRLYLLDAGSEKLTAVSLPPDVQAIAWSKDSARLVALTEEQNGASDLRPATVAWSVTISDPNHATKLSDLPATIQTARWSDDGGSILFLAQAKQDTPPGYRDLFRYDLSKHSIANLTDGLAGSVGVGGPWTLPGGVIVQTLNRGFGAGLARFVPGSSKAEMVSLPTAVTGSFDTNATRSAWVFLATSSTQPHTLFYTTELGKNIRALQTPDAGLTHLRAVAAKPVSWKSGKRTIEGLLYMPPGSTSGRVPMIVQVHGGPLGAYQDDYSPYINFLVGNGWAVLRTNPRGSTNYGAEFAAANKNDLGGGDYEDIMAGVDSVLKTERIDPDKLALEGYSYGGEMAGFVEGKTTRFKAIVSGAPVIDQYSEYGTEGDSWYDRWYFGKPWEHPQDAWRQSPLSGAGHAKTPFLLLQGEGDTTDPLGQAQEMYRALRQMNVPVEMVTYPRENHGPLARAIYGSPTTEPWHGFDARRRIVEFISKAFGETKKETVQQ